MTGTDLVQLEVGPVAHGGHCVARLDGRVVFVRHTLPGETVRAVLTEATPTARFWRADAVEVIDASADRVPSAWPAAGPGGVGGGELAHVALPAQRRWKQAVLAEQLRRLGGVAFDDVPVRAAPGDDARGGLGYRTRIDLEADASGRLGMGRYRSHEVVALAGMPLAVPGMGRLSLFERSWQPGQLVRAVAPSVGDALVVTHPEQAVTERVVTGRGEWEYQVPAGGFWQAHAAAPQVLVDAVLDAAGDVTGRRIWDLYAGSGLFALPLATAAGPAGRVTAVESAAVPGLVAAAVAIPQLEVVGARVERWLRSADRVDVVVLDPPRTGAGRRVIEGIVAARPELVVYIACDPAALGRDIRTLRDAGYEPDVVTGYDLFPMTHHVESVAVLRPARDR